MKRKKKTAAALVGAAFALLPLAPAAAAPTCSEQMGIAVHGQHVVGDYVVGDHLGEWSPDGAQIGAALKGSGASLPGGPGAKGHGDVVARGASFCISQARSPGFHF